MPHTNDPTRHYVPVARPDGSLRTPEEAIAIARRFGGTKAALVASGPKVYDPAIGPEYLVMAADGREVFPSR